MESTARMSGDSALQPRRKPLARSRVSNGTTLLAGVDGRSTWVRRCRDVIEAHLSDLGGPDNCSEAERSIIRRAATLTTELERFEVKFALAGEASADDLEIYQRAANSLRRLLEAVGLRRRPRNVTPDLADYLDAPARYADPEEADAACRSVAGEPNGDGGPGIAPSHELGRTDLPGEEEGP